MPKFSSAATGVAGFLAAHEIMQMIDPNHSIPEVPAEAIEGSLAGAIGAGLMTSLGASVALAPEMVAGGVGYVVGAATSRAVHGFMTDHGFSETIAGGTSALVGGATGGVAASVSGMATAFALFGTSLGPAGILMGAAGGALLGAAIGFVSWLFSSNPDHPISREVQRQRQRLQELHNVMAVRAQEQKNRLEGRAYKTDEEIFGSKPGARPGAGTQPPKPVYMPGKEDILQTYVPPGLNATGQEPPKPSTRPSPRPTLGATGPEPPKPSPK